MEIDIPSFIDKLKSPSIMGQISKSEGKTKQSKAVENTPESREISAAKSPESQADINTLGNNKIDYHLDHKTSEVVIRILDNESGEVIKQIPGEEFLRFTNRIAEFNEKTLDETV